MASFLDANGLHIESYATILARLQDAFKLIYGVDINLDSDSPDGQYLGIITLEITDLLNLINQVYSSFDPDQAIGTSLDSRVAINSIVRLGGSYTQTPIDITVDRALNLPGLSSTNTPFTVADDQGNQFYLITDYSFSAPGTQSLNFRAKDIGLIDVSLNSITNPITVVIGITTINNSSIPTTIGQDQETDSQLKARRNLSLAINAQGYLSSILAALNNISGVVNTIVYENTSGTVDSDGIPGHSIWCIVEGGSNADIAEAIYEKRNAGCGMKGAIDVPITQIDGSTFHILFDRITSQDLYIQLTANAIGGVTLDPDYIKTQLVEQLIIGIYESIDISKVVTTLRNVEPNCYATGVQVSTDGTNWYNIVTPTAKNYRFLLSTARIDLTIA